MPSRFLRWSAALRSAPSGLALSLALSAGALQAQTTAAPIEVRNAQGKPVVSALAWKAPAAARMQFTVQGKFKNLPYQTKAQLDWLPQGQRYEASQEVQIPVLGSRRQASVGAINANGLRPEIFLDRSRKENSATFDAQAGQIRFSRGSEPAPLVPGTQDRMSVFFQLAGMLAAAPKAYPAGTRITVQAASTSRVAPWTFTVRGTENLALPAGRMAAIKLEHNSDSNDAEGVQSALWIAPSLGYLPVRIRMVEDGGRDELDLKLTSHSNP
ncbi:DUF3108 domain-containing protein [Comamonas jiangduensis]|uniref:DUF3108 domain-containing protein n=1 Tax=Comamonas jiangduensis TaxID=1194168 RepID=UPI0024E1351D|nr:DUF3108 domain-containing protein [Comamonas jiangduensis]